MLKIKNLLEKQKNINNEKISNLEEFENKKTEIKITQNTEVPTDDQINDLTKYNFQKNSTNLQTMGGSQKNSIIKTKAYQSYVKVNQNKEEKKSKKNLDEILENKDLKEKKEIKSPFIKSLSKNNLNLISKTEKINKDKSKYANNKNYNYSDNNCINNYLYAKINITTNINANSNKNYLSAISINNSENISNNVGNINHSLNHNCNINNLLQSNKENKEIIHDYPTNNNNNVNYVSQINKISKSSKSQVNLSNNSNNFNAGTSNSNANFNGSLKEKNAVYLNKKDSSNNNGISNKTKKDSIDFGTFNSFRAEKEFFCVNNNVNNLNYVNKCSSNKSNNIIRQKSKNLIYTPIIFKEKNNKKKSDYDEPLDNNKNENSKNFNNLYPSPNNDYIESKSFVNINGNEFQSKTNNLSNTISRKLSNFQNIRNPLSDEKKNNNISSSKEKKLFLKEKDNNNFNEITHNKLNKAFSSNILNVAKTKKLNANKTDEKLNLKASNIDVGINLQKNKQNLNKKSSKVVKINLNYTDFSAVNGINSDNNLKINKIKLENDEKEFENNYNIEQNLFSPIKSNAGTDKKINNFFYNMTNFLKNDLNYFKSETKNKINCNIFHKTTSKNFSNPFNIDYELNEEILCFQPIISNNKNNLDFLDNKKKFEENKDFSNNIYDLNEKEEFDKNLFNNNRYKNNDNNITLLEKGENISNEKINKIKHKSFMIKTVKTNLYDESNPNSNRLSLPHSSDSHSENNLNSLRGSQVLEGKKNKKLSNAREKKFITKLNDNRKQSDNIPNSEEKNSDIKKLNQKLDDVCQSLDLFKIKSDSVRNSLNLENFQKLDYKKDSINERFSNNILRSSDPTIYNKINLENNKFVKNIISNYR